jgi:hypothetical protein
MQRVPTEIEAMKILCILALADVPERKQDYVQATYELDAPAGPTTVAVKITDMLGEEVLIEKTV